MVKVCLQRPKTRERFAWSFNLFTGRRRRWFSQYSYSEQLLAGFAIIGSFLAFVVNLVAHLSSQGIGYMWVNFLFCGLLLLALPLLLVSRRYELSACYLLLVSFGWITVSLIDVPSIESDYLYWFSILPLAGGLLARFRGLMLGSILAGLGLLGFTLNSFQVLSIDVLSSGEELLMRVSSYIIFILMVSFLTLFFLRVNESIIQSKTRKLDTLLKIVSHDIANPLTLIRGLSDLLIKSTKLDESGSRKLNKIYEASDTIHRILERVRHIQAIKSGILVLRKAPTSIREAVTDVQLLNENGLQKKKLQLDIDLPKLDLIVMADPVTFTNEVLNNLVTNAIKFSPVNSRISIRAYREGAWAVILVADQGIGIPDSMQHDVFDEFKLTTRLGTEGERGTGFGLPLVKNLVDAFGGSIILESKSIESAPQGHGTRFKIYLPLAD